MTQFWRANCFPTPKHIHSDSIASMQPCCSQRAGAYIYSVTGDNGSKPTVFIYVSKNTYFQSFTIVNLNFS